MRPELDPTVPESLMRHADFVRQLARAILRDEAAADDVMQETWMAAIERPPAKADSLRSWLGSVARRFALRRLRSEERRWRREQQVARSEASHDPVTGTTSEPTALARELLLENVTRAVLDLKEPYRSTVIQRYYQGWGPQQIAQRTGVPVATVASRLQRAIARIRTQLDERTEGGRSAWSATATSLLIAQETILMSSKLKLAASVTALGLGALALWTWSSGALEPASNAPLVQVEPNSLERPEGQPEPSSTAPAAPKRSHVPAADRGDHDEQAPSPATGSLLLKLVWEDTDLPAAGRAFEFFPWDAAEPFMDRCRRSSDERGEIRIEELAPGSLMMYGELGGGGRVTIVAGETTRATLRLPAGMHVTGRVLAPDGRGVAGASVWLSDGGNDDEGQIVAESGAGGHFTLQGVGPSHTISAFARGFGPVPPLRLEGNPGETLELALTLAPQGGRIEGLLADASGRPVGASRGARIRFESADIHGSVQRADGTYGRPFAPLEVECDEDGRFDVSGLPPMRVRVSARAPGLAPEAQTAFPTPAGTHVRFTLRRAGIVYGEVRDAQGQPLAEVSIGEGKYGGFASSFGRSRADGSFRLANLPVGPVELTAEHKDHGRAKIQLELEPDVALEWSPTLAAGHVIAGHVVDGEGAARVDFVVDAVGSRVDPESGSIWSAQTRTSEVGSFRFANCPDEEVSIELHTPQYVSIKRLSQVRASDSPLTFVVREDELPSARLRGRLLDVQDQPVVATLLLYETSGGRPARSTRSESSTGLFELGPLPPGTYSLRIRHDDLPEIAYGQITLAPHEELDLGTYWLGSPTNIRLEVTGHEDAGPFESVTLFRQRTDAGLGHAPLRYSSDQLDRIVAWPGSYVLRAEGTTVATETLEIVVGGDGSDAIVPLRPGSGTLTTFVVRPGAAPLPEHLGFSIVNDIGHSVAGWGHPNPSASELAYEKRLRPGRYVVTVYGRRGELTRVDFLVDDEARTVDLALK